MALGLGGVTQTTHEMVESASVPIRGIALGAGSPTAPATGSLPPRSCALYKSPQELPASKLKEKQIDSFPPTCVWKWVLPSSLALSN